MGGEEEIRKIIDFSIQIALESVKELMFHSVNLPRSVHCLRHPDRYFYVSFIFFQALWNSVFTSLVLFHFEGVSFPLYATDVGTVVMTVGRLSQNSEQ